MTTTLLTWPERPTCHKTDSIFRIGHDLHWRDPRPREDIADPYEQPFRTCSYCGSINPEDLYRLLSEGNGTLSGSDWKYGWPHKFYLEGVANPIAGVETHSYCYGPREGLEKYGAPGFEPEEHEPGHWRIVSSVSPAPRATFGKWYNEHLDDEGYSPEAWDALAALLEQHAGIRFFRGEDGRLMYRAPRAGYQR